MYIPDYVAARAASEYIVDPSGCHISTRSVASHGYAQIGWNADGKRFGTTAHRAAWVSEHGQIPEGMTVDHVCRNRRCVLVKHLRLLTNFENGRRTRGRDWPLGQCINGHPNSELLVRSNGVTECRICLKMYRDRWNAKMRQRRKEARMEG